ncbi:NAD(P)/FAD-dependent oxidoreductase [Massilia sp. erpn]|uniref:flavin-containing monooxygenase n=1 Tax=Massilia sp. erpn TaxID=2738142 RepID=UPI002105FFF5|nr:NAD(P)-binding domain-containing protein [Massilia sp. erpn]UTY57069.1 NAD(P)-binding domain-containing protein [Massilia sp. erpn]
MQKMKVCVIGSGNAGLVTIKELLDEGHDVICYEQNPEEGGNFRAHAGSYQSLRLTITQKVMCYSSMPSASHEAPTFWTRHQYLDYLRRFADKFVLRPHIHFNSKVHNVKRLSDGRYQVHIAQGEKQLTETFDAVAVCQGPHRPSSPRLPKFEGQDAFQGLIMHSAQYVTADPFVGKKVVCVGFGESAGDIITEISAVTKECWTTFRRWPSLAMRWDGSGFAGDAFSIRASQKLPGKLRNTIVRRQTEISARSSNPRVAKVAEWNLKCEHHIHKFLQKNDDFVPRLLDGKLHAHCSAVKKLTANSVIFEDGKEIEADIVLLCTGFDEAGTPQLIDGFKVDNVRDMFRHSIHPDLGPRVAFIGWARPAQGGVPLCSEMQARYFSLLCSGKKQLPAQMRDMIERERAAEEEDYFVQSYMKTLVNYSVYLDSMASLIGCLPGIKDMWYRPELLIRFMFGSNIPSWYRLVGPHANPKLALENLRATPVPFTFKRGVQFSWINFKLWLTNKLAGRRPAYSLFN